jgi:hypothetical protein
VGGGGVGGGAPLATADLRLHGHLKFTADGWRLSCGIFKLGIGRGRRGFGLFGGTGRPEAGRNLETRHHSIVSRMGWETMPRLELYYSVVLHGHPVHSILRMVSRYMLYSAWSPDTLYTVHGLPVYAATRTDLEPPPSTSTAQRRHGDPPRRGGRPPSHAERPPSVDWGAGPGCQLGIDAEGPGAALPSPADAPRGLDPRRCPCTVRSLLKR